MNPRITCTRASLRSTGRSLRFIASRIDRIDPRMIVVGARLRVTSEPIDMMLWRVDGIESRPATR